jgi:hypothetical protein
VQATGHTQREPEVKPVMTIHNFRGLTAKQAAEIKNNEPLEVSLFIGGKEFRLDGITLTGGTSLLAALLEQRRDLNDTIKNRIAEKAEMLEMTVDETRLFLVERALYLDLLIGELTHVDIGQTDDDPHHT